MGVDGCLWLDSDDSGVAVFDGWLVSRSDTEKSAHMYTHKHTMLEMCISPNFQTAT